MLLDDIKKLRELAETGEGVYEERLIIDVCDALEKAIWELKFYGLEGGCRSNDDSSVAKGRRNTRMLRPGRRARELLKELGIE